MSSTARAAALVFRHGRTSTSFRALGRGLAYWYDEGPDGDVGVVAYVDTGGAWVAAGEPIGPPEEAEGTALRFVAAARDAGRRASFFATEGVLAGAEGFSRDLIGEQPVWNPQDWAATLAAHRSLRHLIRPGVAKGIAIERVTSEALHARPALRSEIDAVIARWLASRTMAPMQFLVEVDPLGRLDDRRLYVALRDGRVVALLSMAPVPARNGWFLEHLHRDPSAPNGAMELLVDHAMKELAAEGVDWATLGLAPLAGDVGPLLRLARRISKPFYNFRGVASFKRKLKPGSWVPVFLVYPRDANGARAMLDSLRAFAGRPLVLFALQTTLHGPSPLLQALALFLMPWTILLALAPTARFFPSPLVHGFWIVYDVFLLLALYRLRKTGSPRLARGVAIAVTVDAALTVIQAAISTVPSLRRSGPLTPLDFVVLTIACAGPLITAPMLWGAARRHARLHH